MQNTNDVPESRRCKPTKFYKKSTFVDMYEGLQLLRNSEIFCDIKLKTDDHRIITAHKVVLSAVSPFFRAMLTTFTKRNHDLVVVKNINNTSLLILVNFIYTGQIVINEENVQDLLPGAILLQLQEVKEACCEFLQSQLGPTNCIGINGIADLHSCTKLIRSSELYILQHFSEVFGGDEFLSLSSEQVIKLISSDKLTVPSEEKVFESVIRWVNYESSSRRCILPQLMKHVRLALISKNYVSKKIAKDPLIKKCLKCKHYVSEALKTLKGKELIPQSIQNKPRHQNKVILVIGGIESGLRNSLEYFDPITDQWHFGPELITNHRRHNLVVIKDNFVFDVGGYENGLAPYRCVHVLDLSSNPPCWLPSDDMLVERQFFGVGAINDNIYAVGGANDRDGDLKSAEVFDFNTQEWRLISSMNTTRSLFAVGVLNDLLYVVGGFDESLQALNTVECYNPSIDKWTPVANMREHRSCAGVGVLNGELYVVSGRSGSNLLRSVEKYTPSTGVWTTIANILLPRKYADVIALDGLLYVIGGMSHTSALNSAEYYNPYTNTWALVPSKMNLMRYTPGVVAINRPKYFTTY